MTTDQPIPPVVVQEDRWAAVHASDMYYSAEKRNRMALGEMDDHPLVQAFARHRTTSTAELLKGLEFYADPDSDGYNVKVTNYGLSTEEGDIIRDRGERARALIAKHRPASSGDQS